MRMLVVGAGSVGGYFGGRLCAAGRDVTFLVRPQRAAALRRDGLRIVSTYGDVTLHPRLVTADAPGGRYDAVLLGVKAYALDAALEDMAGAVGPDTMILPVLNGMRHNEAIRQRFGAGALVGCLARCATWLDADGRIIQKGRLDDLTYGEMDGQSSARIVALDAMLTGAGFKANLSDHIERELWEKWVLLATLGAANCLLRGTIGEILDAPGGADLIRAMLREVIGIVTAAGVAPDPGFVQETSATLLAPKSTATSSMYRDMMAGRPVETDQILGDLVSRGRQHGIEPLLIAAAHAQLSVYAARLAAG